MEAHPYYQANQNGTVDLSEQPTGPTKSGMIEILKESLSINGWELIKSETRSQPYEFKINSNDFNMDIYIYCWRISNGGRGRQYEQRIQIGDVNGIGFDIDNSNPLKKGLLLGIYQREESKPIIIAWETEKNRKHGASKSCFVDIKAIAQAMKDGFIQTRDNDNNLVCAFKKEFLNYYIANLKNLHSIDFISTSITSGQIIKETQQPLDTDVITGGTNKIIYGAPGVGKSYSLGKDGKRVTFHPEYTYFEFVGGLKPGKNEEGEITYDFIPGPFLRALRESYDAPDKMHTLIIEEINRANTAAVFGDIFQLLDRDVDGFSEYSIENKELLTFINENRDEPVTQVKIPGNLNIFATMNSADQGVFVMDSAFKRRWEFEYLGISFAGVEHSQTKLDYRGYSISWFDFASTINKYLSSVLEINEDKLIGPYFIKKNELSDNRKIAYKLLIYLWDDVLRHQRNEFFAEKYSSFSDLSEEFISGKQQIFIDELDELLFKKCNQSVEGTILYE